MNPKDTLEHLESRYPDPPPSKERPLLFTGPMVRAILEGRKTQTRRVLKPQLEMVTFIEEVGPRAAFTGKLCASGFEAVGLSVFNAPGNSGMVNCPYGQPGDRLWVRETFQLNDLIGGEPGYPLKRIPKKPGGCAVFYAPDGDDGPWRPAIHMPRWASRITLEIVSVSVERLQDISEGDAKAEGVKASKTVEMKDGSPCYSLPYQLLWNQINGCDAWDKNPWVWCISFRRIDHAS